MTRMRIQRPKPRRRGEEPAGTPVVPKLDRGQRLLREVNALLGELDALTRSFS